MPTRKEINAIINLSDNKRYEYSIKRIADFETLFVIGDDQGLRTYHDGTGKIVFPIWPFREFALLCCTNEFASCQPEGIQLKDFMESYLLNFIKSGYKLSVLPLPSNKGAIVDIDVFKKDIENELRKY
jgi:hypothetical protein